MDDPATSDWPGNLDWAAQLAAATAWWREAGVDCAYVDEPHDWLEAAKPMEPEKIAANAADGPARREAPPPPPPAPRIGGERSRWPATLADFADWWLAEPSLDVTSGARRILPSGPANAALMVLVGEPEADDRDLLLSGPQGRLLDAILAAFGLSRAETYVASILPRHTPFADWEGLAAQGMAEVVAHHVALAAPQRLLVFGRGGISALVGHDPAQAAPPSLIFNHEGGSIPLAIAPELESLLERPVRKAGLWARWLEWTEPG